MRIVSSKKLILKNIGFMAFTNVEKTISQAIKLKKINRLR